MTKSRRASPQSRIAIELWRSRPALHPGTHNADRLLRLPGTINFPNAKKMAQGRITRQSSIVKLTDVRYPLERFPAVGHSSKAGQGAKEKKGGGKDSSRSAKAFRAGAALKFAGATYEEMRDALLEHQDPEIAEWANTKGMDNGERELRRVYDRALTTGVINLRAPYDTARLFQRGLAIPPFHHRGGFFEWSGCAWLEVDEAGLRARLYAFLDQCKYKTARGELKPVKPNAQMVAAVLDALRAAAHLDAAIEPPAWLDGEYRPRPSAQTLVACATNSCICQPRYSCRTRHHSSITTRSASIMSHMRPSRGNGSIS